jgi:hypothetical protein
MYFTNKNIAEALIVKIEYCPPNSYGGVKMAIEVILIREPNNISNSLLSLSYTLH